MKNWFIATLAFLLLFGTAQAADSCLSGSFYDPEASGEGIVVEVLETQTVVYFYRSDNAWIVLQGTQGNFTAYQSWNNGVAEVGAGDLVFLDEDTVAFSYSLLLDVDIITFEQPIPWCLRSDCWGDYTFVRLTQPNPCN